MFKKNLHNYPELKEKRTSLRNHLTPAEAVLWKALQQKKLEGRKFRRQHSIGKYIVDFYCYEEGLAVELDGEVHNDPVRYEYDAERTHYLNNFGIKVIRIENRNVFEHIESVREYIKSNFTTPAPPKRRGT